MVTGEGVPVVIQVRVKLPPTVSVTGEGDCVILGNTEEKIVEHSIASHIGIAYYILGIALVSWSE